MKPFIRVASLAICSPHHMDSTTGENRECNVFCFSKKMWNNYPCNSIIISAFWGLDIFPKTHMDIPSQSQQRSRE